MSTLKTASMSEDLPDSGWDETCISCVQVLSEYDKTHLSHNEKVESVDDGAVVVMTNRTTSRCIPVVIRKSAPQSGRETWKAFVPLGWHVACPQGRPWPELWAGGWMSIVKVK